MGRIEWSLAIWVAAVAMVGAAVIFASWSMMVVGLVLAGVSSLMVWQK